MIKFTLDLLIVLDQNDNVWCGCSGRLYALEWSRGCTRGHSGVQVGLESKNGGLGFGLIVPLEPV